MEKTVSKPFLSASVLAYIACTLAALCLLLPSEALPQESSKKAPSTSKGIAVPGKEKAPPKLPNPAVLSIGLDKRCRIVVKLANKGKGVFPESIHGAAKLHLVTGKTKKEFPLPKVDPAGDLLKPGGGRTFNSGVVLKSGKPVTARLSWPGKLNEKSSADNTLTERALKPGCIQADKGVTAPLVPAGKGVQEGKSGKAAPGLSAAGPAGKAPRPPGGGPVFDVGKIYLVGGVVHVALSVRGVGTPPEELLEKGSMTVKTPAGKGKWSLAEVFTRQAKIGAVPRKVDFNTGLALEESGKVEVKIAKARSTGDRHAVLTAPAPSRTAIAPGPKPLRKPEDAVARQPLSAAVKAFGRQGGGIPGRVVPMMLVEGIYILDPSGGDMVRLSERAVDVRYRFTHWVEGGETRFRLLSGGVEVAAALRMDDAPEVGDHPQIYSFSLPLPPGFSGCTDCVLRVAHGSGNYGESDPFTIGETASFVRPPDVNRGVRVELVGERSYAPGEELVFRYRRTCEGGPTPPDLGMFYHPPDLGSFDEMYRWGVIPREHVATTRDGEGYIRVTWRAPRPEEAKYYVITVLSGEECWGSSPSFLVGDPSTLVIGAGGSDEPSRGVTLRSPNGGERFTKGDPIPVEWDIFGYPSQDEMPDFRISLYRAGETQRITLPFHDERLECVKSGPGTHHRCAFNWPMPAEVTSGDGFGVSVSAVEESDRSDGEFTITGIWIEGIIEGATYYQTEWRRFTWGGAPGTEPEVNIFLRNSGGTNISIIGPADYRRISSSPGHSADFLWLVGGEKTGRGVRDWGPNARNVPAGSGYRIQVSDVRSSDYALSPPFTIAAPELWIGCFNSLARHNRWGSCEDVVIHDGDSVDISWGGEDINPSAARVRVYALVLGRRYSLLLGERDFDSSPFRHRVTKGDLERRYCDRTGCHPLAIDLDIDPLYFRVELVGWNVEAETDWLNYVE